MNEFLLDGPGWKPETKEEVSGDTKKIITTVETPKGSLRRVLGVTQISKWEEETALIEYPVKTDKDYDLITEFMPPVPKHDTKSIEKAAKLIGDKGITSPSFHGPFNVLGYCYQPLDHLLMLPILNPELFHRMMQFFTDRILQYVQQMAESSSDIFDIGANMANSVVVSSDFLVEHILPYENRIADFALERGIPSLYHNCGYAANHLDVYDQLHHKLWGYMAPIPHGDTVLEDAIEKLPRDMILWGHVDQIDFLRKSTPSEIRERVKYICETIKPRGNYILGTTDYLEIETPPENIKALVEAGREFGSYD
jgi:uroporphyrinogen-III decarboxylase